MVLLSNKIVLMKNVER